MSIMVWEVVMKARLIVFFVLSFILSSCGNATKNDIYDDPVVSEPLVEEVAEEAVEDEPVEESVAEEVVEDPSLAYEPSEGSYIAKHGPLSVQGTNLLDVNGDPIQLRGISSHGLHFQGSLINIGSIGTLVNDWGINVFRGAMYVAEDGYIDQPDYIQKKLYDAIDYSTYHGIYVVADWHVLWDKDPMRYVDEASDFFHRLSLKYANYDNIIYEICNEPNGDEVTWANNIKPYAEIIIPIIRANDPDAVIVVGSASWSQDLRDPADDPLDFENIMYTCHFYAGSHGQELRDNIQYMLDKNMAVFVSEWGTSLNTGRGGVYPELADEWLDYLDANNISWINWSLAALGESSALLIPNAKSSGGWPDEKISKSGHYIKNRLAQYE